MLLDNTFPPTTREGVKIATVQQLRELQALRGTDLTGEEWGGWRRTILADLVSYPYTARLMFLGGLACVYVPVGALIAAIVYGSWSWGVAGVGGLLLWGLIAYRQGKAFA